MDAVATSLPKTLLVEQPLAHILRLRMRFFRRIANGQKPVAHDRSQELKKSERWPEIIICGNSHALITGDRLQRG